MSNNGHIQSSKQVSRGGNSKREKDIQKEITYNKGKCQRQQSRRRVNDLAMSTFQVCRSIQLELWERGLVFMKTLSPEGSHEELVFLIKMKNPLNDQQFLKP